MIANLFIDQEGRLRAGWRWFVAMITVIGAFLVAEVIAGGIAKDVAVRNVISRTAAAVIMLVTFLWMARVLDHVSHAAAYIGLGTERRWMRDLAGGSLLGGTLVSVCIGVIAIVGHYGIQPGPSLEVSRLTAAGVVAWIFVFGALAEELGFRSYPFQRLIECFEKLVLLSPSVAINNHARLIGSWIATLLLAGLFGAGHLANPNATFIGFANTVLIGIFFGILMVKTGSLWLLWGVHFGWNFTLGALYGLPVSGIHQFSVLWTGQAEGPTWLTGGPYGIEASAPVAVLILLAILVVAWLPGGADAKAPAGIKPE